MKTLPMNFKAALELLAQGKRIIREADIHTFDQQWFNKREDGTIDYMNEPWTPSVEWLQECIDATDWVNVEEHCNYHDHSDHGECLK